MLKKKVVNPIVSFSAIEQFIKKGDKIESDGLIDVYSRYLEDETEIGNLARSYTNLIDYANEYIEDIKSIESEKKRIETELEIAERIQQANLPEKSIENRTYYVNGFSKPAKEVGGDFYDYYPIDDENVAVIIGDASGKGVPAAIVAIITQSIIKQLFKTEKDPSKILFSLNNQLCENNPELMFITLWIGVYNKNTGVLTYSNAGHERPLISKNGNIEFLEKKIDEYKRDMEQAKIEYEKPFQYENELKEKMARQFELNTQLDLENNTISEEQAREEGDIGHVAENGNDYPSKERNDTR